MPRGEPLKGNNHEEASVEPGIVAIILVSEGLAWRSARHTRKAACHCADVCIGCSGISLQRRCCYRKWKALLRTSDASIRIVAFFVALSCEMAQSFMVSSPLSSSRSRSLSRLRLRLRLRSRPPRLPPAFPLPLSCLGGALTKA